ncbi:MAG: iron-containing alcohol dehydrogenase [Planctomycetaceae bacterium]|nr:iron-containing alcohol dehydrogenase [Planctomycetaceae bacterium]
MPTKINFGRGIFQTLPKSSEVLGRRVAVVTESTIRKLETVQTVIDSLNPVTVFDQIRPNPTTKNVDTLSELLRGEKAELVIAVGGGSVLDCAKAASCLAMTNDSNIRLYHSEGKTFADGRIPVITVPTTAGTGSEVTPIAVLDDEEKCFKSPMSSHLFYPVSAVIDSDLTLSVPIRVTASTALDAFSHALEGFWSKNHQPVCDLLAKEAARIILTNLGNLYKNLADPVLRGQIAYAALLAGIAFQMPKNAIIHACSFPLSNRFHLPHGEACAFTMEAAIRLNTPFMEGRMEEFALAAGFNSVTSMIDTITVLKRSSGLPCTLRDAGIDPDSVALLVKESFHPLLNNNPKTVTETDLYRIYDDLR